MGQNSDCNDELDSTGNAAASIQLNKLGVVKSCLQRIGNRSILALIAVLLVGFGSFFKFVALPAAADKFLAAAAKDHRLDIAVRDWSVSLWGGTITAKNVSLKGKGRFTNEELFVADSVTANFRRSSLLSFSPDLVASVESLEVNDLTVYVESKNGGSWNWESAMSARNLERQIDSLQSRLNEEDEELSTFDIASIEVKDLSIVWIEHLQAASGNGRIQRLTSELNIDDAQLVMTDILGWFQKDEQPIRIDFDGRTADGLIKASGEINPFWLLKQPHQPDGGMREAGWMPAVHDLTIYLENVDTKAFGNMVPDS